MQQHITTMSHDEVHQFLVRIDACTSGIGHWHRSKDLKDAILTADSGYIEYVIESARGAYGLPTEDEMNAALYKEQVTLSNAVSPLHREYQARRDDASLGFRHMRQRYEGLRRESDKANSERLDERRAAAFARLKAEPDFDIETEIRESQAEYFKAQHAAEDLYNERTKLYRLANDEISRALYSEYREQIDPLENAYTAKLATWLIGYLWPNEKPGETRPCVG